ncbi:His/Gly/Thr/Pro-type tRNA ligase C-terminal domain-containing protein [Streptomyces sp. NPDC058257]|uniref:His/Gly/Thr/Pro-type tRNA ligase C-terminal domain-containing protein n=1 Tax=Streptomyces sp. NPDC058257 TaxID=3346409 RepID=UPI0036E39EA6
MGQVVDVQILDSSGNVLWRGSESDYPAALGAIDPDNSALRMLADEDPEHRCTRDDVMRTAETLQLVSRQGGPRGFLTTLPRGAVLEAGVDAFNARHLAGLEVNTVHLPVVFDGSAEPMRALADQYGEQGRTFEIADADGGADGGLTLAYATDPGLFSWLKDAVLQRARLPYAMYSPQPVFRRFGPDETDIRRRHQFNVPDVHIWCHPDDVAERYLHALQHAAESTAYWFQQDYVHVLDSVVGTSHDTDDFHQRCAKAAGGITVVRRLAAARPERYAQQTGILVSSGYELVTLQNLRLDEVNASRFNIRMDTGEHPGLIHARLAMGGSRLLPLLIGRGLSGLGPRVIPAELAWHQVVFLPLAEKHVGRAYELAGPLWIDGVRTAVDLEFKRPIGARIARLRSEWQPLYCVVGDRELSEQPRFQSGGRTPTDLDYQDFLAEQLPGWLRCRPDTPVGTAPLPFAGAS